MAQAECLTVASGSKTGNNAPKRHSQSDGKLRLTLFTSGKVDHALTLGA